MGALIVFGAAAWNSAGAVTTRVWVSVTFSDFDSGKGKGVMVTSFGKLVRGDGAKRTTLPGVTLVFAAIESGGAVYLGTGDRGEVWVDRGGRVKKLASLSGAVLVTCFTRGPKGTIYAGTLPEGRIYSIDAGSGRVKQFAKVAADHVWALSYERRTRTLYAATGPKGELFAVDAAGRSRVYWKSGEKHLLSMTRGPRGALFVGSAPKAIVYRILGQGRALAIHDFDGSEVRAMVGTNKDLYVAVNKIKPDRSGYPKTPRTSGKGTPIKAKRRFKLQVRMPRLGAKKGKGGIFRLGYHGAGRQLYGVAKGYFTALALYKRQLWAGEGTRGRVIVVFPDDSSATAFNVKERQVLSFSLDGRRRVFGTGDGASLYRVGAGAGPPTYTSKAYDTSNVSRFGVINWRANGNVQLSTRSGNTAEPDKAWSAWRRVNPLGRAVAGQSRGRVTSPPGRYVQFRFTWPGASRARVDGVRLHFTPVNRAPRITMLSAGLKSSGTTPVLKASWVSRSSSVSPTTLKISWKASDADGDPLVYRVYYRTVGDVVWRKVGTKEYVKQRYVKWKTDSLPDGWYAIKVVASDERTNSTGRTLTHTRISSPVLIDHTKPKLVGLRVNHPVVTGLARDAFSRITGISYSVDGGKRWFQVEATDGNFDQEVEGFTFRIKPKLRPGGYTLLIKAYDAAGNAKVEKRALRVR